ALSILPTPDFQRSAFFLGAFLSASQCAPSISAILPFMAFSMASSEAPPLSANAADTASTISCLVADLSLAFIRVSSAASVLCCDESSSSLYTPSPYCSSSRKRSLTLSCPLMVPSGVVSLQRGSAPHSFVSLYVSSPSLIVTLPSIESPAAALPLRCVG